MAIIKYEIPIILRYCAPDSMRSFSSVNIYISVREKKQAAHANTAATAQESFSAIPAMVSIDSVSRFPQYWAASIVTPDESPVKKRKSINCIWLARETAASAVCPTYPSMITSAEPTAALIKFCNVIGHTSTKSDL